MELSKINSAIESCNGIHQVFEVIGCPKKTMGHYDTNEAKKIITNAIRDCDCVETLKKAAIKFDGMSEFFELEGRLIDLIGDEYFDFADKHDLC